MSALPTKLETLAIHGGTPVREKLLPYGRQSLDEADVQAVVEVLKSDWLTTGPKIGEFEERFAAWSGRGTRSASVQGQRHCTVRLLPSDWGLGMRRSPPR